MDEITRKKNQPTQLPQTFQSQKENWERRLCHRVPSRKIEGQQDGCRQSFLQIKAVRWR